MLWILVASAQSEEPSGDGPATVTGRIGPGIVPLTRAEREPFELKGLRLGELIPEDRTYRAGWRGRKGLADGQRLHVASPGRRSRWTLAGRPVVSASYATERGRVVSIEVVFELDTYAAIRDSLRGKYPHFDWRCSGPPSVEQEGCVVHDVDGNELRITRQSADAALALVLADPSGAERKEP